MSNMSVLPSTNYVMLTVIVNFGMGSKVLHIAKEQGVNGGTITLGRGTVKNKLLEFLAIDDIRKEIVYMVADHGVADKAIAAISKELRLHKPNHGIAYMQGMGAVYGLHTKEYEVLSKEDVSMYQAITVIVEKGKAEMVIEAATKAGSKGGTILNARGSGLHETSKFFAMEIEPEKEVVLILAKNDMAEPIVTAIRQDLHIDEPSNGILFVQEVLHTYGLAE